MQCSFWIPCILFEIIFLLFFLEMVIFTTLFRRLPTLWTSTLKMKAMFWGCLTLYLKKTVDQAKRSRCTLIAWDHSKVFSWEWYVTAFAHFRFLGYVYSWDALFVIKSTMVIVNIYLTLHFYLRKCSWVYTHLTNVSDEAANFLTYYFWLDPNP